MCRTDRAHESWRRRRRQRAFTFTVTPITIVAMLLTSGVPLAVLATALAGWALGSATILHSVDERPRAEARP